MTVTASENNSKQEQLWKKSFAERKVIIMKDEHFWYITGKREER